MKARKLSRLFALIAATAIGVSTLIGIQAAQAATGANCTVKSTVNNAVCDVVTYGTLHRVTSLDATAPSTGGYTDSQMSYIIQGMLYRFNAQGVPSRDLVEKAVVSADGKTVTHTLRSIKYSDGTALVAADVVVSYNRWVASKQSSSYIEPVASVVAQGTNTVVWTLKRPYPAFDFALAQQFLGIHPGTKSDTLEKAKEYFKNPVSAGPMKVKTFSSGTDLFVVEANPNYWAKSLVKELRVVTIPDGNTRLAAFQAGTIDYAMELPLTAKSIKWDKSKYRVTGEQDSGTFMLAFNMGPNQPNKALTDPRVRQAISMAVDRTAIMRTAFANLAKANCGQQFNFNNEYAICSLPNNGKRDLAGARKLLKEAGYPNGFKVKMPVPNRLFWQDAAQVVRSSLNLVGIDVTIDMVTPDSAINGVIQKREWEMMWFGNNAATPILQLSNWFKSGGVWVLNANVPESLIVESSKLLSDAAASESKAVIATKLAAVEKIAFDLSIFIPIGNRFYLSGNRVGDNIVEALLPGQLQFVIGTNPGLPKD